MKKKAPIRVIKAQARARGCTCDPDVTLAAKHGLISLIDVRHDSWCTHRRDDRLQWDAIEHELRRSENKQ